MDSLLVDQTVVDLPVLDARECEGVLQRLESVRPRWIPRSQGFATLGVATYLDVMCSDDPQGDYYERIESGNRLLRQRFGDVLERVAGILSEHLQAPTEFEHGLALPGFHIFEGTGIATETWPNMHFDLQHRSLRWPLEVDEERLISFTLSIRLPAQGGGLEVWDVTEADFARLERLGRRVTMNQIASTKPSRIHRYHAGLMAVQSRPIMHRIAAIPERLPGDQRITLQGHGIGCGDSWLLYW